MDIEAYQLAASLVHKLNKIQPPRRLLVGIAGVPASGKSTFAHLLVNYTNTCLANSLPAQQESRDAIPQAVLVGLDGWHFTRAQLDVFPDPKLAYDRRGIHWTFDGSSYVAFVRALHQDVTPATSVITAPSFDHALKDPTPDAVSIYPFHRIVIIEGLYTFLSIEPWSRAGLLLDERWYIHVEQEEAQRRLVDRHVVSGVAKDREEAIWRAEENDVPNGRFIISNLLEPTRVIQSIDEPKLHLF